MSIAYFEAQRFRNLGLCQITPSPYLNIIYGDNGSGKTSLLEALYYLGRARSFRTAHNHHLIAHGQTDFVCFGKLFDETQHAHRLGVQRSRHEQTIKLDGQVIKRTSDLVRLMPLQIINNDVHHLLEGGPKIRRRFLDWGVFHTDPAFGETMSRYRQILKQRNAALKQQWRRQDMQHWNKGLVEYGGKIDAMRKQYLEQLIPVLDAMLQDSFNLPPIELKYQTGWDQKVGFSEALEKNWESDLQRGITQCGPHKADIKLQSGQQGLKDFVSRGQQKIITTLLVLSQIEHYAQHAHETSFNSSQTQLPLVLLIDDLPAELDRYFGEYFLQKILHTQSQLFVTATDYHLLNLHDLKQAKLFHVEHGQVAEHEDSL